MQELEVYSMIGAEGFTRLVAAFYRHVPRGDLLGPMYPAQDLSGAEQRLQNFLIGGSGGRTLTSNKEAIHAYAAFSVPYTSGRPRSMDALDE